MEEVKCYGFKVEVFDLNIINEMEKQKEMENMKNECIGFHPMLTGHALIFKTKETAEKYRDIYVRKYSKYANIDAVEECFIPKEHVRN